MLKKGDKVVMHTCMEAEQEKGRIWTCRTDEQKLHPSHNYTVVWLEGYSGCFSTEYLQKIDLSGYIHKPLEGELTVSDIEHKIQERLEKCEREGLNTNRYHELLAFQGWLLCGDEY